MHRFRCFVYSTTTTLLFLIIVIVITGLSIDITSYWGYIYFILQKCVCLMYPTLLISRRSLMEGVAYLPLVYILIIMIVVVTQLLSLS